MADPTPGSADLIAVVGMSCRFPGAIHSGQFWHNIRYGIESRTVFTDDELAAAGVPLDVRTADRYVNARGIVDDAASFDHEFFGMTPREAELTDPQQRVFLECCHEALEDAGLDPARFPGSVGVFAGCAPSSYFLHYLAIRPELLNAMGALPWIGNAEDHLTSRVSYKLGLRGPAVTVAAACATSLVAVHLGCQSLLSGESDAVLAGGVSIFFPQRRGSLWEEGGIQSPDGRCRTFDIAARGTYFSDGCGIVVLRRLADAERDGDDIRAVVLGTAVNNNGARRIGYTAPSVQGQADVIAEALSVAGIDPHSVQFVEAHGTGTPLGDPIELAALREVYRAVAAGTCAIGSVKTNIGHTDRAAGVAGLMKAVLALRHAEIPPNLHFTEANPELALGGSPFHVPVALQAWPHTGPNPRRAAVSSFGIGGTNAHAVLEQAVPAPAAVTTRPCEVLVLSARSEPALASAGRRLARWLDENSEADLADVAYTLAVGRTQYDHRCAVVAGSPAEASRVLGCGTGPVAAPPRAPTVVFLFSGQGAEYAGMGAELYRTESVFRRAVDECCHELADSGSPEIRDVLVELGPDAEARLRRQAVAQPALFVFEYALAALWKSLGVTPATVIGHSLGELVAATTAGVFRRNDALRLAAERGRLVESLEPGGMLAVGLPEVELASLLPAELSLAAVNGSASCVVSGPVPALDAFERTLGLRDVPIRRLVTSRAMHSAMTERLVDPFATVVSTVARRTPAVPLVSTVTGSARTDVTQPVHWGRQLRDPVRYLEAVTSLLDDRDLVLIEVGPRDVLARLTESCAVRGRHRVVSSVGRGGASPTAGFAAAVGQVWTNGCAIDWPARFAGGRRRKVALPTYPFARRHHLLPLPGQAPAALPEFTPESAPASDLADEIRVAVFGVWRDLLGVENIDDDDSFFRWSDSLGASRLAARLRDLFAVEFALGRFYENPTMGGCASMIRDELADDLADDLAALSGEQGD